MKIRIKIPADAEVTYDADKRELIVEPFFTKSDGRSTWGYVSVQGDNGAERKALLQCSGSSGQCFSVGSRAKRANTAFDKMSPGAEPAKQVKKGVPYTP